MNKLDLVRMEKSWNEICGKGKWENPYEKSTQTLICPARTPHGVTKMQTQVAVEGENSRSRAANIKYTIK